MTDQRHDGPTMELWSAGPRPGTVSAQESIARATLDLAASLARAGDQERARQLCATVVLETQPIIMASGELFQHALYAMLIANSFRLISRLVLALNGCNIRLLLASGGVSPVEPLRSSEQGRHTIYYLDPRWIENLSPDDTLLEQWSASLRERSHLPHGYVRTLPVPHVLEHV